MPWRREYRVEARCYPAPRSILLRALGGVLIAAGVLVILICVPFWAWLAIVGAALILLGILLIRG